MQTPRISPEHNQTRRSFASWASKRAWSRVGAVAEVLQYARTRRVITYSARVALHLTGCVTVAIAVAMMLWNDIGVGPLDVFIGAIRNITGLPLALSWYSVIVGLSTIAWTLGRRPGLGTIATTLLMGPLLQVFVAAFANFGSPNAVAIQVVIHLIAISAIGIGCGAMIVANIGVGAPELLTSATSARTGMSQPKIRMGLEVAWLLTGALLGGPVGLGTVLVAVAIGPAVATGYRFVDAAIATLSRPIKAISVPACRRVHTVTGTLDSRGTADKDVGDSCRCRERHPVWHAQTV